MQERKHKILAGVVIGKSSQKTIKVGVDYMVKHPKYGKYLRRRTRLAVHDELNQASVDDKVEITESRPYSKTKSWRLVKILEKAVKE